MVSDFHLRASVAIILIVLSLASPSQAQSRKFTGQIFAYSPWEHLLKLSSFVPNQEIVIFRLRNRPTFVKLVFVSFGQEQLNEKYFDGSTTISVRAKRDTSCDETAPQFFGRSEPLVTNDEASRTSQLKELPIKRKYKLASAFAENKTPALNRVDCYAVESPRR